jgi:PAS domain S-box-containing protein
VRSNDDDRRLSSVPPQNAPNIPLEHSGIQPALSESERRYRALSQTIGSIVWTADPRGRFVTPQPAWSEYTGQTWEQMRDFGWIDALHADDQERVEALWQAAQTTQTLYESDGRLWHTASNAYRYFEARGAPVLSADGSVQEWVGICVDVEHRKQTETAVSLSETRYRRLFESAKDGILILDAETAQIADANPFIAALLGYSQHDLLGKELWQIGLFADAAASKVAMQDLQEKHYIRYDDLPLETKAGRRIEVEFVSNVYQEGPQAVIQCNIRDITERKRVEEQARRHALQFESLLNEVPLGVFLVDHDLRIQHANPVTLHVIGNIPDLIGRDFEEVIHRRWPNVSSDEILQRFRHTLETGEAYATPEPLQTPGDRLATTIYEWQTNRLLLAEGRYGVLCCFRDISDRVHAAHTLREREAQYHRLFGSIDQGFCVVEVLFDETGKAVDYRFLQANPMFEQLTGLSGTEGRTARELTPNLEARSVETYGAVASSGKAVRFVDGPTAMNLWLDAHAYRLGGEESRKVAILFTNISERKRLESEREHYINALQEADRHKDQFLAMLAHELRNPLAPMRNVLTLMKHGDLTGERLEQMRSTLDRQLSHLVRLVDDLLDVSRVSLGKTELRMSQVELSPVIRLAVADVNALMHSKGQKLAIALPSEPLYVNGDAIRLAQVFNNLLSNACKYTNKEGRIQLTVERDGQQAVIRLRDEGIGISSQHLARVFDMFMQADSSLERTQSGLGLGLTLVKNLVELHAGSVQAYSAGVGHGSEFVVRLPISADSPKAAVPEPRANESESPLARRILVVDDNQDAATTLAMLLRLSGIETKTAFDGVEALDAAEDFRPDIMLLDIGLPLLNGYGVARKIRESPWGKAILLVALTGWGQQEDRRKSQEAGFNAHMVKPVDYEALMQLLAETGRDALNTGNNSLRAS